MKDLQLVCTGSRNYTPDALRSNDEVLFRFDNDKIYSPFLDNWKTIRSQTN